MTVDLACLVPPPPQLLSSTFQLLQVALALECGDRDAARAALYSIDLHACRWYWTECGRVGKALHRADSHEGREPVADPPKVPARAKQEIGDRDGWRCRYCSLPVVHRGFFNTLHAALPAEFPDSGPVEGTAYPAWQLFQMTPDHVIPLAAGGPHELSNLVTSCGACNYKAKGDCTLDELGLSDPRDRDPILDGWNGLGGRPRLGVITEE